MNRLLAVLALKVAPVTSGGPATAQVIPPECEDWPWLHTDCIVEEQTQQLGETHSLPASVTHYTCDASGQAPAGALDETADLQAWIDSVPDGVAAATPGSTVAAWHVFDFPQNSCIRVDGYLSITDRNFLAFDGNGVTLDQHLKPPYPWFNGMAWSVVRGSHLQWTDFKIIGNLTETITEGWPPLPSRVSNYGHCEDDPTTDPNESVYPPYTCEWQGGWGLYGVQLVLLDGNETKDTRGDSVEMGWDYPNQYPNATDIRFVRINDHKVYGAGRQGISAVSGQDIAITNSYIEGAAQHAIDLEPTSDTNVFPMRRVVIVNNQFGQSHTGIFTNTGVCVEVSDILFTGNTQLEPNISNHPAIFLQEEAGCSRPRGPIAITKNDLLIEEWGQEGDYAAWINGYDEVTLSSNVIRHSCNPRSGCNGSGPPSIDQAPFHLAGGSGQEISRNNLAVTGSQPWWLVYRYNGAFHGSLGTNVSSCGNTTAQGPDQPQACLLPVP